MTHSLFKVQQHAAKRLAGFWLGALLLLAQSMVVTVVATAPAYAASDVKAVRIWRAPDHTRVVLDLTAKADYKLFTLQNPGRVVVDLSSASLSANLSALDLAGTPVKKIRGAARGNGQYRLVMDLQRTATPSAFVLPANQQYGHRLVIDLYEKKRPTVVKTSKDHDGKRDLVIAIDAGHGGEDPGALGPRKIREKQVVLAISRELQKRFDQTQGYRAVMIRDGDYYVGLGKRRQLAREAQADLFLSIHADAFTDKRVRGGSVYTLSQRGASSTSAKFLADSENKSDRIGGVDLSDKDDLLTSVLLDLSMTATQASSKHAAKDILQEMGTVARLHKRTVEHAGFAVLKSPDIPSVLVETGFISNPKEARRLANRAHQKELAQAIYKGVVDYFNKNAVEGTYVHWAKNNGKSIRVARASRVHKVRYGDTLSDIAVAYSVSLKSLRRHNKLKGDSIRVGQKLKIPAS